MSQFDFGTIDPTTKSGATLASDLNSFRDALHSTHKGSAAPSYAVAGLNWIDDSGDPLWIRKVYDGANWIAVEAIDATNNVVYPIASNPRLSFPTAGGTADALTLTPAVPLAAYANGDIATLRASADNTGAATLNVSGVGAKAIRKIIGGADVAVAEGDIRAARRYVFNYDAAANGADGAWILVNPSGLTGRAGAFLRFTGADTAVMQDIVGTVSLSGGAVAGSVIESGSNATGSWIKLADGTMRTRQQVMFPGTSWTSAAYGAYKDGGTFVWPAAFYSAPTPSLSWGDSAINSRAAYISIFTLTTTGFALWGACPAVAANAANIPVYVEAEGRWAA